MGLFNKQIVALDWDHRELRVVSATPGRGQLAVHKLFQAKVPADVSIEDPASLGPWLAKVLGEHHCGRLGALVAVPRDQVVLKTLSLPPTPPNELAALVHFQMQTELPFAAESAVIDYTVGSHLAGQANGNGNGGGNGKSQGGAGQTEVLVAATRREVIDYYRQVAAAAGLKLRRIGLRCFCNLQTLRACAAGAESRPLLLVNVGPELTEIDIIRGWSLLFSRSASVAMDDEQAPENFLGRLSLEVVRSVQAARATAAEQELDGVVVAAPEALGGAIADRLSQRLNVRAAVLEPGRSIVLPAGHRRGAGEFSAVLGLALGQTGAASAPFDLLHPHAVVDLAALKRRKRTRALAVAAATLLIAWVSNMTLLNVKDNDLARRAGQVSVLEKQAAQLDEMAKAVGKVNEDVNAIPPWLAEFASIHKLWRDDPPMRQRIYLTEFKGDCPDSGQWRITLSGLSRKMQPEPPLGLTALLQAAYPDCKVNLEGPRPAAEPDYQAFDLTIKPVTKDGK